MLFPFQIANFTALRGACFLAAAWSLTGSSDSPYDIVGSNSLASYFVASGVFLTSISLAGQLGKAFVVRWAHAQVAPHRSLYDALWAELLSLDEVHGLGFPCGEVTRGLSAIHDVINDTMSKRCMPQSNSFSMKDDISRSSSGSVCRASIDSNRGEHISGQLKLQQLHFPLMLQAGRGPWDDRDSYGDWGTPETSLERLLSAATAIDPDLRIKVRLAFFFCFSYIFFISS